MLAVVGAIEIVGVVLTVTCAVGVLTEGQFCRLIPVKEYVVVEDGLRVKELPVRAPGCKVYVIAPPGVSTVLLPEHIVVVTGAREIVGVMLTVTCAVGVFTEGQFCKLIPLRE